MSVKTVAGVLSAQKQRGEELKNKLQDLYLEYDEEEILDGLFDATGKQFNAPEEALSLDVMMEKLFEENEEAVLLKAFNDNAKDEYVPYVDEDDWISELQGQGYIVFKPQYDYQADQLKEYAETVVFPFVNDQQLCIL